MPRHYSLRNVQQFNGGFTDLFVLSTTGAYNAATKSWGSDFTAAALTQSYDLYELVSSAGVVKYIVGYPIALVIVRTPFTDSAANPKLDVGVTGTAAALIAGVATDLEAAGRIQVPAAAVGPLVTVAASAKLTALITSASGNISALAGNAEIYIYAGLLPIQEWSARREG